VKRRIDADPPVSKGTIAAALLLIPYPYSFPRYSVPYADFVGGVPAFSPDRDLIVPHLVNGTAFYISVLIVSKFVYDQHYRNPATKRGPRDAAVDRRSGAVGRRGVSRSPASLRRR
jgi:hypothetical protein